MAQGAPCKAKGKQVENSQSAYFSDHCPIEYRCGSRQSHAGATGNGISAGTGIQSSANCNIRSGTGRGRYFTRTSKNQINGCNPGYPGICCINGSAFPGRKFALRLVFSDPCFARRHDYLQDHKNHTWVIFCLMLTITSTEIITQYTRTS